VLVKEDFVLKRKVIFFFFCLLSGKGDTVFLYQRLCLEIIHLYAGDLLLYLSNHIFSAGGRRVLLWCCKATIFIDRLPQAQQFTAATQSVFKVHWGYGSPGRKN